MGRSVKISTPIPTLDEFGSSLGLSKKRQDSLLRVVHRSDKDGRLSERHRDVSVTDKKDSVAFRSKK
jgi:hypothetical protein